MSSSTASSSDQKQIIVWEGEWPAVKHYAKYGRIFAFTMSDFCNTVLDFRFYGQYLSRVALNWDRYVVSKSVDVSKWTYGNPWIVPAAGVGSVATFVFAKSVRWGLFAATRNGVLAGALSVGFLFPHEIRRLATEVMPF
jgi:hypothetical protein